MSRNGSGTYSLPSAAFVAGTTIDPSPMNANFTDIAAQITNSVAADGQTTMTGALKMGGQNISNAGTVGVGGALSVTGTAALSSTLGVTLGITGAAGITSTGIDSGNLHFRATNTNYGAGWRNDNTNFYLGMTNNGSPTATINSLRPFIVALNTGAVTLDFSGAGVTAGGLFTAASITSTGSIQANGYRAKAGTSGGYDSNFYNIHWTGAAAQLYMDTTLLGSFAYTSDPRIKQNIADAPAGALDRVMAWRVVEYEFADVGLWRADGSRHLGFDAAQLRQINEKIVTGAPDDLTPDGGIQPMTLNVLPMLAEITAALQSVVRRVEALEHTS